MLKRLPYLLLFLVLLLAGCTQQTPLPTPINGDSTALFDDTSLRNAQPISISGENELTGQDLNNETQAIELPYDGPEESPATSDLSAQAVLPGVKGFVALYRKNTVGTYEIRVYNQTNNAATTVYSGTQEVQSVAVDATASKVVASMKNPANNKFDVYLFQMGNPTPFLLTNTATLDESNVSMTRTGNKIAWEGPISTTNATLRPYVCALSSTFSCTLSFLTSSFDQIQPSLSANGLYMALVRVITNPTRYAVLRYTFATNSYTFVSTIAAPDIYADPSIDDTGSKLMFSRRLNSNNADYIMIRDLLANTLVTELGSTSSVSHPFITAEGQFAAYSQVVGSFRQVRTRNIATNAVAIQEAGSWDYFQPFWMVPCGSGPTITGDQTLTTQAQINALAGVSKITGSLFLSPSSNLDFSPLASLTEVTGAFDMVDNPNQTTLSGFECLTTVGGGFFIEDTALTSISGFGALTTVGGVFAIFNNATLTSLPSFAALTSVGGFFEISNTALTGITGFIALTSVGGNFDIFFNDALTSITGFTALTSVGGNLDIFFNDALTSITGFNLLESGSILGTATVRRNPRLNCQNPVPHFSPVDVSTGNLVNCPTQ